MEPRNVLRLCAALITATLLGGAGAGAAAAAPANESVDVAITTTEPTDSGAVDGVGAAAGAALGSQQQSARAASTVQADATWNRQMLDLVNAERARVGVAALSSARAIDAVAQAWAEQLAADRVLKHNPNYSSQIPAGWQGAGENVAWSTMSGSAAHFFDLWKNSSGHYANMVGANYDNVGFGIAYTPSGGWYAVQVFARYGRALDAGLTMFTDVTTSTQHSEHIVWLATAGISTGYSDGTFRPTLPVGRDAMAAFMYRLAGSPAFSATGRQTFVDVSPGTQFHKEIEWLAAMGISTGWDGPGGREYRPLAPVSRDAMAAFLYRLYGSPTFSAPTRSPFLDVSSSTPFYKEMAWLAANGISTGWAVTGGAEFRPLASVNRDAMAAFMHRSYDQWGTPRP